MTHKPPVNRLPASIPSTPRRILIAVLIAVFPLMSAASEQAADSRDAVINAIQGFLHEQIRSDATDDREIQIRVFESAASFPDCPEPQPFLPQRGDQALRGDISVGVRCNGEAHRVRYLRARIAVFDSYVTVAGDIPRGTTLEPDMLEPRQGNLAELPPKAVLDSEQVIGHLTRRRLSAGTILQRQHLQRPLLVERGQPVTIESRGRGFVVTREGEALEDGSRGETIRVRLSRRESLRAVVVGDDRVRVGGR